MTELKLSTGCWPLLRQSKGFPCNIIILFLRDSQGIPNVLVQGMESEYKKYTAKDKESVVASGGLMVIGTERHESRRIDNQLRGRSGR